MSRFTFRPAVRQDTPLIIGLAGPTKSGKTLSALRVATGLAGGKPIIMINAEGARGHQYADKFTYIACDLTPPFRPELYTEALTEAAKQNPGCIIIDSASHMHDGPGGILEWHEEELDRIAGQDEGKRQRSTFTAWIKPKASENEFIYALLGMKCPVILCLRAKEKLKIIPGKQPVDLGWQPIVGERVAFETMFTLVLPPHSKGVPDLSISDMRQPFDRLVPENRPLDEKLGERLAEWAKGGATPAPVDTETGEVTLPDFPETAPHPWSREEFSELLKARALTVKDLAPAIGAVSRDSWHLAVDAWLLSNPGKGIRDLIDTAGPPPSKPPIEQPEMAPFE